MKGTLSSAAASLSIIYLLFSIFPVAQASPVYPNDTVIFFGNGILTTHDVAGRNRDVLEERVTAKVAGTELEGTLKFSLSYNSTGSEDNGTLVGVFVDLLEAYDQMVGLNEVQFWQDVQRGQEELPEEYRDHAVEIAAERMRRIKAEVLLASHPEVFEHVDRYNALLSQCKRVLVVPHSQGNLFANIGIEGINLFLKDAFGIVSVANPDNRVGEGNAPYTTNDEDLIIKAVDLLFSTLDSNVNNYGFEIPRPFHAHNFTRNYLDPGRDAETKILNDIVEKIVDLRGFNNIDYCGWPAVHGDDIGVFFQPYDIDPEDASSASAIWDRLWHAAVNGELIVQFSRANEENWITLNSNGAYGYRVEFTHDVYVDYLNTTVEIPPWVYIVNTNTIDFRRPGKTIEVQVHDQTHVDNYGLPGSIGVYQYRFIIDNQVIDQFRILQNPNQFHEFTIIETSQPIADPLNQGSLPIIPLP